MLLIIFLQVLHTMKISRLAVAIPIGIPITVANDAIEMPTLATDRTIKDLLK